MERKDPDGGLTRREQAFLKTIRELIRKNRQPPTREELRVAMGWKSLGNVQYFLRKLQRKGAVEIDRYAYRGIRLPGRSRPGLGVPVLRRASKPRPPYPKADVERHVPESVCDSLFRSRPDYFLRIDGSRSLAQVEGLCVGDLVAVRRAETAGRGRLVVLDDGVFSIVERIAVNSRNPPNPRGIGLSGQLLLGSAGGLGPVEGDFRVRGLVLGFLRDGLDGLGGH